MGPQTKSVEMFIFSALVPVLVTGVANGASPFD
jgi:hypothetical protein